MQDSIPIEQGSRSFDVQIVQGLNFLIKIGKQINNASIMIVITNDTNTNNNNDNKINSNNDNIKNNNTIDNIDRENKLCQPKS